MGGVTPTPWGHSYSVHFDSREELKIVTNRYQIVPIGGELYERSIDRVRS